MNIDTIKLNRGINQNGGAYWCQNIRPANDDGVFAGISMINNAIQTESSPTAEMGAMRVFTQVGSGTSSIIFSRDSLGDIYAMKYDGGDCTKVADYTTRHIGTAQGLMIDTNDKLVYTGSDWIGMAYTTTLDGVIDATASSITLATAVDFPNAGFGFVAESGAYEVVQWTGKTSNTLTGVTRGKYNSIAKEHSSGSTIYYFKDQQANFVSGALNTSNRRCIKWEDRNFFVSGNSIEGYINSGAGDIANRLTLSSDKEIIDLGILQTSATSYVLVGANSGENGYLYVWDGKDSVTISERELKNNNITRIWDNFIATDNGIYQYDGTLLELITEPLENSGLISGSNFNIFDMKTIKNYLLYTSSSSSENNRNRSGLYYVDLKTKDTYCVLPSNYGYYGIGYYAIFPTFYRIFIATTYNGGAIDYINEYPSSRGSIYRFIYNPTNAKTLQLKGLKINLGLDTKETSSRTNINFDIIVRGYDYTRKFAMTDSLKSGETPSGSSRFIIRSNVLTPVVGDRIEIVENPTTSYLDVACAPRNITAVTPGTGKYIIDVDDAFPSAITLSEQNLSPLVVFNPLKKLGVGKISVNDTHLNLQGYDILLREQPRFKKMLFEIEVRCGDITIAPQLNSMEISYEILD